MTLARKTALLATGIGLAIAPGALAAGAPSNPGPPVNQGTQTASASKPTTPGQPGPGASLPAKAKAYGFYCQNQSKTHVAGQSGTPFSQCVTAMAKLASGTTTSPKTACAAMSKQHVAGQKGTPFSNCVAAGAKLLKDQHKQNP
jgi:hypothetical protein